MPETPLVWAGCAAYVIALLGAWHPSRAPRLVLAPTLAGVLLLAAAITVRWSATGQGPFLTLHEFLLSNLFSLGLVYGLAHRWWPAVRPGAAVVLATLLVLAAWTLSTPSQPVLLPASYGNPWLWVHVIAGKLFLGACLVASGLAGRLLLAGCYPRTGGVPQPDTPRLDDCIWRCMLVAFAFESAMLLAGAAWARDAWGRFWSWDPLETWALVTWLLLGAALHLHATHRIPPALGWGLVWIVFVIAVMTFLGFPFLSVAPHKGVV